MPSNILYSAFIAFYILLCVRKHMHTIFNDMKLRSFSHKKKKKNSNQYNK